MELEMCKPPFFSEYFKDLLIKFTLWRQSTKQSHQEVHLAAVLELSIISHDLLSANLDERSFKGSKQKGNMNIYNSMTRGPLHLLIKNM